MRKLASLQRVREVIPIPGADAVELIKVQGWQLVAKKDEFRPGDMAVYCEIDSVLPERPEFEFLRPKKFKIKTIRLRGQLSQGIAFRVQDVLPGEYHNSPEGTDVTAVIGVKHVDDIRLEQEASKRKGLARLRPIKRAGLSFPSVVPKTDEERIQNLQTLIDKYKGHVFYVTEKMDGSSFTAYLNSGEFGVCSRNWRLGRPGDDFWSRLCAKYKLAQKVKWVEYRFASIFNKYAFKQVRWIRENVFSGLLDLVNIDGGVDENYWKLAIELDLESKLKSLGRNLALQGEMCGPSIQGNKYELSAKQLFVFNVFNIDTQRYLNIRETEELVEQLGLRMVPMVDKAFTLNHTIDELLKLADGHSQINKKTLREGLVFRLLDTTYDTTIAGLNHGFVSFKAISNKWLEKHDK